MTSFIAALVVLSASAEHPKVASVGLRQEGVEASAAQAFTARFDAKLQEAGVELVAASEIGRLLTFDQQQKLAACSSEPVRCLSELGKALQVDAVASGSVLVKDGVYEVELRGVCARAQEIWGSFSARPNDVEGVSAALDQGVAELVAQIRAKLQAVPPPPPVQPKAAVPSSAAKVAQLDMTYPLRRYAFIPLGLAVLAGGTGFGFTIASHNTVSDLAVGRPVDVNGLPSLARARAEAARGAVYQNVAIGLFLASGVGLGVTGYFVGHKSPLTATAVPWPGGAAVAFSGAFP